MNNRETLILAFLSSAGWSDAARSPLAGDASNRRYERLALPSGGRAVLMDAPPERNEDVRPFVRIAKYLSGHGMSAPEIFASDDVHGLLLLEDLGDDLFARVLDADTSKDIPLYSAAIDALVALHQKRAPDDLATYSAEVMAEKAALAWQWYLCPKEENQAKSADQISAILETNFAQFDKKSDVLIQRDFHAENLIWLPKRAGNAKVGMLDFQDALIGHRAYDLVSLLQDARRDVAPDVEQQMIDRYLNKTGLEKKAFLTEYHLLGVQRNLRILGVFARLSLHFGKAHYIDFMPRVWGYLERDLAHPAAAELRDLVLSDLPAPTPDHLQQLRDLCGTVPTL